MKRNTLTTDEAYAVFEALTVWRSKPGQMAEDLVFDHSKPGALEEAAQKFLLTPKASDSEVEHAVEARLATFVGGGRIDELFQNLRAAWVKLVHASVFPKYNTVEKFDALSLAARSRGYRNPSTGVLLRPWIMTTTELKARLVA